MLIIYAQYQQEGFMTAKWEYNTLTKLIDGTWVQAKPGCDDVVQYTAEDFGETPTLLVVLHILGDQGWEVCTNMESDIFLLKRAR